MNAPVKTATIQTLRNPPPTEASLPAVNVGFTSLQSFELTQRVAKLFATSTLVPLAYRFWVPDKSNKDAFVENAPAISNCCLAINMAARLNADPLMVMQNLHIIEGRPGWSAVWIIASINQCGRFEPLKFDFSAWSDPKPVSYEYTEWEDTPGGKRRPVRKTKQIQVRDRTCIAWTVPKGTKVPEKVNTLAQARAAGLNVYESTPVSIDLAVKEGWYQRTGSKWQTMPDQMLAYRTAAFFGRLYAPELLLGLPSEDELHDVMNATRNSSGTFEVNVGDLINPPPTVPDDDAGETIDPDTGEITGRATTNDEQQPAGQDQGQDQQQPTGAGPDDREAYEEAIKLAKAGKYEEAQALCPPAHSKEIQEIIDAELERRTAANRQDKGMPPRDATPARGRGR